MRRRVITQVQKLFKNMKRRSVFLLVSTSILFVLTSFFTGTFERLFYLNPGYTQFSCRPFDMFVPYFHTKVNISKDVKLWSEGCNDLSTVQVLSETQQFTKCDADNKPFQHCTFENVKLETAEIDRLQIEERGLSDKDKDGLTFHGVQISGFRKSKKRENLRNHEFIRNVIDLERQSLPKNRSRFSTASWPILTKKFGLVVKSDLIMKSCATVFSKDVFLFHAYHSNSVWHLHEGLFRLWRTMDDKRALFQDNITVIQIDKEGDAWYHKEYLDIFGGVRWLKLKDVPNNSCFMKLHVVGYPQHMFDKKQEKKNEVKKYRSFVLEGLKVNESTDCFSTKTEITFISRRNRRYSSDHNAAPPGNRHLYNEDDIIKEIGSRRDFNVAAYSFEKLSKREQVVIACKSDILIGVHSGALLNAMWLKPGALLLQTQVPGSEYGTHEIWKRPPLLVVQGIGYFDMQQLAENIGVYYSTLFAKGFDGPSAAIASCKIPGKTDEKFLKMCYSILKKKEFVHKWEGFYY